MKKYKEETIIIDSKKFQNFLKESLCIFYFWNSYLENNSVKAVITSHSVYNSSIILRIAISKKILVYQINLNQLYKLDEKNKFAYKEFNYFRENFSKTSNQDAKLQLAKNIERRLSGEVGVDMPYSTRSAYKDFNKNYVLKK